MFQRIWHMLIKEFILVLRDPRMRAVTFVTPIVEVLVIGYAVTTDVRHVPTAIYDLDNSVQSREVTARFLGSGYFDLVERIDRPERVGELLDRGRASFVLHFDHGFSADLATGRTARVQLLVDGTDSNTAGIVLGYSQSILAGYSRKILVERSDRLFGPAARPGMLTLQSRAWFNENLESRNYFVPGVIVIVLTLISLLLTSMAVVREKEIGTIEQILVTPITPLEFVLGKTLPFALIGMFDVVLITLVGVFWFDVPVRGNLAVLFLGTSLYLMTTLGLGLFISEISGTQQQAMLSTFLFMFPAMMFSGFVFPVANMPASLRWLAYVNPLRYYMVIVRDVFLKGTGMSILWPEMLVLAVSGVATLWLVARRFHKTM